MNEYFKENNKLLWKEVNWWRWEICVKSECVLDKSGRLLVTKDKFC